jgi:serine/threonine-protein kinase
VIDHLIANRYRVLKRIFTTEGYAQLYIAEDTGQLGQPLCIIEHFNLADLAYVGLNIDYWVKTQLEALQALSAHTLIPDLLDYVQAGEELFIVNQFVEGRALKMAVAPEYRWPEAQVINLLAEILNILAFVHQQGMIHGNIKLESIVRRQSDYKLALVGFSLAMQTKAQAGRQQRQLLKAAVATASRFETTTDRQLHSLYGNDIYSLGIVGIQTLTGFSHEQIDQLDRDPDTGAIGWAEHAEVSPDLEQILNTMVQPRSQDRYQSATEALQALQHLRGFNLPGQFPPTGLSDRPDRRARQSMFGQLLSSDQLLEINSLAPGQAIPQTTRLRALRSQQKQEIHPLKRPAILIGLGAMATLLAGLAATLASNPNPNWPSVLAQARAQRAANDFPGCLSQAGKVPSSSRLYDDAQVLIIQCQLEPAQKLAAAGQLPQAIAALLKISPTSRAYRQAQQVLGQWSDRLLVKATDHYRNGNLAAAIGLAQKIPSTSSVRKQAQEAIALWQREWRTNSDNLAFARQALSQGKQQQAISLANRVTLLGQPVPETSVYWQQQVSPILKTARTVAATPSPSAAVTPSPKPEASPSPKPPPPVTSDAPPPPSLDDSPPEPSVDLTEPPAATSEQGSADLASPTPQNSPAIAVTEEAPAPPASP